MSFQSKCPTTALISKASAMVTPQHIYQLAPPPVNLGEPGRVPAQIKTLEDPEKATIDHLRSMPFEVLQRYAITCVRKVKHLEIEAEKLQTELQTREAQYTRRSKQLHQSTSVKEEQLSKSLKQAEFELAAERSIRKEIDKEQTRLRDLCKKAKDRIGELVACRLELEKKNEELLHQIEILKDTLAQSTLVQEHWKQHVESQELEIQRQRSRQERLEEILENVERRAAITGLARVLRIACQEIDKEKQGRNEAVMITESKHLQHDNVTLKPDDTSIVSTISTTCETPSQKIYNPETTAVQLADVFSRLAERTLSQLPKIPIDLSSLTVLPHQEKLPKDLVGNSSLNFTQDCSQLGSFQNKSSPAVSSFSTSAGDSYPSVSSLADEVVDEEITIEPEAKRSKTAISSQNYSTTQFQQRCQPLSEFSESSNHVPATCPDPLASSLDYIITDDPSPLLTNTQNDSQVEPLTSTSKLSWNNDTFKGTEKPTRTKRGRAKHLTGIRAKLQGRGQAISAEDLYPVPNQSSFIRKSSRISASIRKVKEETFRGQFEDQSQLLAASSLDTVDDSFTPATDKDAVNRNVPNSKTSGTPRSKVTLNRGGGYRSGRSARFVGVAQRSAPG